MGTHLRLTLKPGFRDPVASGAGFVGRQAEVARLASIFRHRGSATVLVSGHRGVGKTTLVDQALRDASKPKTVVARLSLPHIDPADTGTQREVRGQILRALARALHFASKDSKDVSKELKGRAQALYDKTYLKSLEEQGQLEAITKAESRASASVRQETTLNPGKVVGAIAGASTAGIVAAGGVAVSFHVAGQRGGWWGLTAFCAIIVAGVAAGVSVSRIKVEEKSQTEGALRKNSATKTGAFDLSPETLEFELKELLTAYHQAKITAIFVVDELDKLEVSHRDLADEPLEKHVIFMILASLKNFFTIGSGIFVFISGEDFYARLEASIEDDNYSLAHTLFTDRLFVHVLQWRDIETLVDNLVVSRPDDSLTYRQFRNYLCWESRNHPFDLLTRLGDYVGDYEADQPILIARESAEVDGQWHEGNLPSGWLVAAGLQKVVGATFEESQRPGGREERFNQALWLTLLETAKKLAADGTITVLDTGYELEPSRWLDCLTDSDRDDLAGAVDRLFARAERYGLVTAEAVLIPELPEEEDADATATASAEESGAPATTYTIPPDPVYPDESVGHHAAPTPFENGFRQVAATLAEVAESWANADLRPSTNAAATIKAVGDLAARIEKRTDRKAPPRTETRRLLNQADTLIPSLLLGGIRTVARQWATDHGCDFGDLSAPLPAEETPAVEATAGATPSASDTPAEPGPAHVALNEFEPLRELLLREPNRFALITRDETENQVLVLFMPSQETLESVQTAYEGAAAGEKGQDRRVQRLPIVEVRLVPPDQSVELPTEVLTVTEPDPSKGWAAWINALMSGSTPTRERKVTRTLAGWQIFQMDPTGKNMRDLKELLSRVQYIALEDGPAES